MSYPSQELDIVRQLYAAVESHPFTEYDPADYSRLAGCIDLHTHAGPGRQDIASLGRLATRAGIRALVLKSPFMGSTVGLAKSTSSVLAAWARESSLPPTQVYGGVVLTRKFGGISPDIVEQAVRDGARIIWLPVLDSVNHLVRAKNIPLNAAREVGLGVLGKDGLRSEVVDILEIVAAMNVAISFGHLSREEMLALAEASASHGVRRAMVDHPLSPVANLSLSDMQYLAHRGVYLNFTHWELSPYCGITADKMIDVIRHVGSSQVVLSSDAGMDILPNSVECMRLHNAMLELYGFDLKQRTQMLSANALHLIDLAED